MRECRRICERRPECNHGFRVQAKDLSRPWCYLQIAETCREAGRDAAALDWAERGMKAFPNDPDLRLVEFLADEYHRRRRHDEALVLVWRLFELHPRLEEYQYLKRHAERAAVWPVWRKRALAHLCEKIACPDSSFSWEPMALSSALVRIHLWEKDPETAWLVAQQQKLDNNTGLELADARAKTHPADAIPIYLRAAESKISQTHASAYQDAIVWLKKIKELYFRLNQPSEWEALLTRLRATYKPKRNFIALLAKV